MIHGNLIHSTAKRLCKTCGATAISLAALSGAAHAADWQWTLTPYAWLTDVGLEVNLAGREVVEGTIPVGDLIEDLEMIFQGRVEAQSGQHGLMIDVFYAAMKDVEEGVELPNGAGQAELDWKMDMTIADLVGIYDPNGPRPGFAFLYGARVIDQRATIDAQFDTTGGVTSEAYEASDTLVDFLAGVRFNQYFTQRISLQMQTNISFGSTNLTWDTAPSLSYAFSNRRRAVIVGYRHMSVDFENLGGIDSEMTLTGPVLGFRMTF